MTNANTNIVISPLDSSISQQRQSVHIPGSKSHSIRALLLAALATGQSKIYNLLDSGDVQSCRHFLQCVGVEVIDYRPDSATTEHSDLIVEKKLSNVATLSTQASPVDESANNNLPLTIVQSKGLMNILQQPAKPQTASTNIVRRIDLGNSGTTLYFVTALLALGRIPITLDGDASLRTRSAAPLLQALRQLGARITEHGKHGCVPFTIEGPITPLPHTEIAIDCPTSQYLSALLLALSLVDANSTIKPKLMGEFPYVDMTLYWISNYLRDNSGNALSTIEHDTQYTHFTLCANTNRTTQATRTQPVVIIKPFETSIIGDFSSAAFFLGMGAITQSTIELHDITEDNTQADMAVLDILCQMGCSYKWVTDNNKNINSTYLTINRTEDLVGGKFDLSNIPDALPLLAVVAAYAKTPTLLYNVAHARKKETDRIAVMVKELRKVGVEVEESEDSICINPTIQLSNLNSKHLGFIGGEVDSHHDHRVAMAMSVGATKAKAAITIYNADVASITFPTFFDNLVKLGVNISKR